MDWMEHRRRRAARRLIQADVWAVWRLVLLDVAGLMAPDDLAHRQALPPDGTCGVTPLFTLLERLGDLYEKIYH